MGRNLAGLFSVLSPFALSHYHTENWRPTYSFHKYLGTDTVPGTGNMGQIFFLIHSSIDFTWLGEVNAQIINILGHMIVSVME